MERERQEEIRYCQTVAAVGAASTQAPCARESIALTHSILSKGVRWVARWAKEERVQRGGNSNNPEVFSRSPPGQRGSQDTAKTVRVYYVASIPSRRPLSPSFPVSPAPSLSLYRYLLLSVRSSFHPRSIPECIVAVLSYGLSLCPWLLNRVLDARKCVHTG